MAGVNGTNFYTPKVVTTIVNNATTTPALQGTTYAGIFSSNRGPAYRYYSSASDLQSWCGQENPATTIGLSSCYDMLTQSQNLLAVRIIKPYDANTLEGDATAYAIYNQLVGWKTPAAILADLQDYNFVSTDCFVIGGLAQGTFYNGVQVQVTKSTVNTGYNVVVYDGNGIAQESFYVTFGIYEDGTDADTFAEQVINAQSKYIQIRVNYTYFIVQGDGVLPNAFYTNTSISSGVSGILNWTPVTNSFYNYTTVNDALGNIFVTCGTIQRGATEVFNNSVLQYSVANNTWLQLPNTSTTFSFVQSGFYPEVASVYNSANSGSIYSFLRSGGVDNLVNTLSSTATVTNIAYDKTFAGFTVRIQRTGAAWDVLVDGVVVSTLSTEDGTYSTGGLTFVYAGLTATAIGVVQFISNRMHCLSYSLATYKYTDNGLVASGGFLMPTTSFINSGVTLASGDILMVGYNTLANTLDYFYYVVATNSMVIYNSSMQSEKYTKLISYQNNLYVTGGYNTQTSTINPNLYTVSYTIDAGITALSVSMVSLATTPAVNGFVGSSVGVAGQYFYAYGNTTPVAPYSYTGDYVLINLNTGSIYVHQVLAPYASVSKSNNTPASYIFESPLMIGSTGQVAVLGSTATTFVGQLNGAVTVSNSLLGYQQLALGLDNGYVTDSMVINTLAQLYDKQHFETIDVLADCGFNSAAVAHAIDALMVSRLQGVGIISMPRSYERNGDACVIYRNSLNINDGYTFLATPGEYVRINSFTGTYDLFPISGAVAADFCKQDNANGPWQSPAGPTQGLLNVVLKLPPQVAGTPLTVPYKEISYSDSDLLGKNQVNIIGKYSSQFPGIYLKNDQVLDSLPSLLQSVSIKRLILYIANNTSMMAEQFLFLPSNSQIRSKAYTLFDDWMSQLLGKNGAIYSYQVICDGSNNPPVLVNQGILNIDIIVYPQVPIRGILMNIIANKVDNTISISTQTVGGA